MQENHDFPDDLLVRPATDDPRRADGADPVHLAKTFGAGFDNLEDIGTEVFYQPFRVDGSDSGYHPRSKVFLDTLRRGRRRGSEEFRFELQAVVPVIDPVAGRGDPFTGRDTGRVAGHRDQFAMAACLDAQDTETVPVVMEGDALDLPDQDLLRAISGVWHRRLQSSYPNFQNKVSIASRMRLGIMECRDPPEFHRPMVSHPGWNTRSRH